MRALALAAAGVFGAGCTIVEVRSEGAPPRLSAWPLGVHVSRGPAEAVSVNSVTLGVSACNAGALGTVGAGIQRCQVVAVPVSGCGVAIIEQPDKPSRSLWARIAGQARATCPHERIDP